MRILGFLTLVALIMILVATAIFNGSKKSGQTGFREIAESFPRDAGKVLSETVRLTEEQMQTTIPDRLIENTAKNITTQVSSDATSLVSDVTSSLISGQLINFFKSLPMELQKEVKEDLCK